VAHEDITDFGEEELNRIRRKVTMVFQSGALFDSLTVAENILFSLEQREDYNAENRDDVVDGLLHLVGIADAKDQYPADLSTGYRRAIAIARALAAEPQCILYDEPTTMVDPIMSDHLGDLMLRLKRQLLDALAERTEFGAPESMVEQEFATIWQRLEADRQAGRLDDDDKEKDEATLKADYRAIADRRVRLGLLLGEVGRVNSITVGQDEMNRAMRAEAMRYSGQEQQIFDFLRQNPRAAETLRGPIFEEKVVDFILDLAKVEERPVSLEELASEPEAGAAAAIAESRRPEQGPDHEPAASSALLPPAEGEQEQPVG